MIYIYWCPKCKVHIHLDSPNEIEHIISWKNGITWYEISHRIMRVVQLDITEEK